MDFEFAEAALVAAQKPLDTFFRAVELRSGRGAPIQDPSITKQLLQLVPRNAVRAALAGGGARLALQLVFVLLGWRKRGLELPSPQPSLRFGAFVLLLAVIRKTAAFYLLKLGVSNTSAIATATGALAGTAVQVAAPADRHTLALLTLVRGGDSFGRAMYGKLGIVGNVFWHNFDVVLLSLTASQILVSFLTDRDALQVAHVCAHVSTRTCRCACLHTSIHVHTHFHTHVDTHVVPDRPWRAGRTVRTSASSTDRPAGPRRKYRCSAITV